MPKAYQVWDVNGDGCSTIVFAESRNLAKVAALSCECCEEASYIDIRCTRRKDMDRLYRGETEFNWYDPEIRLVLVRDFGWSCLKPSWECETCQAKQFCLWHKEGARHVPL